MTMQAPSALRVAGARADSLLGYLKAIGLLRLVATQLDPFVSARWTDGAIAFEGLDRRALRDFLMNRYSPSPVLNPWNSGAGFDAKSAVVAAGATLNRVALTKSDRWTPYREALAVARTVVARTDRCAETAPTDTTERKRKILYQLRSEYADGALEWLDAAVLLGGDVTKFSPLLGSGGNDGRLDFSINFAQRALDVVGDRLDPESPGWLADALDGSSRAALLADAAIGQFSPASAGGPNATSGFWAPSLVNPWDYVLMIEGAIAFAGDIVKRFSTARESIAAPFTFQAVGAGYASASESEDARGEIWLPQWRGAARYGAVRSLLRGGRVELSHESRGASPNSRVYTVRAAGDALSALHAAQTCGVASGVERFSRVVIARRNGLAYGATYVGTIGIASNPAMAALSRDTRRWISLVRSRELGTAARAALRSYEEALLAYANGPGPARLQAVILALAELDASVAYGRSDLPVLNFLRGEIFQYLDDGSLEHKAARALCSHGGPKAHEHRVRFHIASITYDVHRDRMTYDPSAKPFWPADPRAALSEILIRRLRVASARPDDPITGYDALFRGTAGFEALGFARLLSEHVDWHRFKRLIRAYSVIEPAYSFAASEEAAVHIPVAFAAMKLLVDGAEVAPGKRAFAGVEIVTQLLANKAHEALSQAYQRLRSTGIDVREFRTAVLERREIGSYCAGLLIPSTLDARRTFLRAVKFARETAA